MDRQTITDQLKQIISPYVEDKAALENINEESDFVNDLNINSANLVDIILDAEEAFDIEIDDEAAERMLNVKAAVDIVVSLLGEKN